MPSTDDPRADASAVRDRRRTLRLLSFARRDELEAAWAGLRPTPDVMALRGPEVGLVMARGRIGGDGSAFNLGEVAVARATVRLASGAVGFGHALGTDGRHAWLAAAFDALGIEAGRARERAGPTVALLERIESRLLREHRVAAGLLLTLCDDDTPVWLAPARCRSRWSATWLRFHTGAPLVEAVGAAEFVVASGADDCPAFGDLARGSDDYPDRGATLFLPVAAFGVGERLSLQGPDVDGVRELAVAGLPGDFHARWRASRTGFPRGVDLVLVCDRAFACLPRSTAIVDVRAGVRRGQEG